MSTAPSQAEFRDAMARMGAAVNIITTAGPGGRTGFSATAVCSVTDSPPTLLVCLNHNASVFGSIIENGALCVNTLSAGQEDLARLFGGKTPAEERFAQGLWTEGESGIPLLQNALASFECDIDHWNDVGTHRVLFCRIRRINLSQTGGV
ncbi:MAG: flavin reductase, partial [Microbacterium sp.]